VHRTTASASARAVGPHRDACPILPGKKYLDWALEDPAGKGVEAVRPIRDEIKTRIETLIAEIDATREA
jgi:protein-tyrosine-phosphatase